MSSNDKQVRAQGRRRRQGMLKSALLTACSVAAVALGASPALANGPFQHRQTVPCVPYIVPCPPGAMPVAPGPEVIQQPQLAPPQAAQPQPEQPILPQPTEPQAQPSEPQAQPPAPAAPQAPQFAMNEQFGATGRGSFASSPLMLGDLLRGDMGITYAYSAQGAQGSTVGFFGVTNPKVAENNNAIPMDRVSFRYNHFHNSSHVLGTNFSPDTFFTPALRTYDTDLYTMQFEKSFFDKLMSVELRVPFATKVSADNDLAVAEINSVQPEFIGLTPTPGNTFPSRDNEFQDLSLIFKLLLHHDQQSGRHWAAGVAVTAPTAPDAEINVTDIYNPINNVNPAFINGVFTRHILVQNETWAVSPFLAVTGTPTRRLFYNGFAQIDIPVNDSDVYFSQQFYRNAGGSLVVDTDQPNIATDQAFGGADDQVLAHLDFGGGYWFYQNPRAKLLKGLAGLLEIHYTTTLQDADLVGLPQPGIIGTLPDGTLFDQPGPVVGNLFNRWDILNLTGGVHAALGEYSSLRVATAVPLRSDFFGLADRSFDAEVMVQFNYIR